jgi:filamentous hemagglutinin family protein
MPRLPHVSPRSRRLRLALLSGFVLLQTLLVFSQAAVPSAITGDRTLGTTVTQSGTIYDITGGTRPGDGPNLFHSFDRFSVGTGDTARFSGPPGITNILSRVTGGQPSEIYGQLQATMPGANLYLLNPSGVLFGPDASLAVSGSFHVSTADFLRFADGAKFFATLGQASVLTVAEPVAFGFLGNTPAPITIQGSTLQVPAEKATSVIGGDITIVGGRLLVPSGLIQITSVASPGEVGFSRLELAPDLQVDSFTRLGQTALVQGARIDASSPNGGGTVVIRSGHLRVDGSRIFADTLGDMNGASLGVDLHIAGDAIITNEALITTDSTRAGRAGELRLTAGRVDIHDALITSRPFASGDGGNVVLRTGNLMLTGGAQISSSSRGAGRGGQLTIEATETLSISGRRGGTPSGVFSVANVQGDAGDLFISTPTLRMDDGRISASTRGAGHAGDIEVWVGTLTLTGGHRFSVARGRLSGAYPQG